jgi:hypothetical protein
MPSTQAYLSPHSVSNPRPIRYYVLYENLSLASKRDDVSLARGDHILDLIVHKSPNDAMQWCLSHDNLGNNLSDYFLEDTQRPLDRLPFHKEESNFKKFYEWPWLLAYDLSTRRVWVLKIVGE